MNEIITNPPEIKQRILQEIGKAELTIQIAMAYFTDIDIGKALVEANNKGCSVEVICSSNETNETIRLLLLGGGVKVNMYNMPSYGGIMHHKFCIIDDKLALNGSYNYTFNAGRNNAENITVTDEIQIIQQLIKLGKLIIQMLLHS